MKDLLLQKTWRGLRLKSFKETTIFFFFHREKKSWQWRQESKFQRARKSQILISQTQSCISAVLSNPRCQGESGVKPVQCEHVVLGKTWVGWRRWEGFCIKDFNRGRGWWAGVSRHFGFLVPSAAKLVIVYIWSCHTRDAELGNRREATDGKPVLFF